jgi:hypothetical protein
MTKTPGDETKRFGKKSVRRDGWARPERMHENKEDGEDSAAHL